MDGSGAQFRLERAFLSSLHVVAVPAQAKSQVWEALSAQGLVAAVLTSGGATATSLWRGALKAGMTSKAAALAIPLVVAALTVGTLRLRATAAPVPPAKVTTGAVQIPAVEPSALQPPVVEPAAALAPPSEARTGAPRLRDQLARESAALTRARAELRAGNAASAQATLSRMQKKFGSGALHQEREVLAIEALAAQGKALEAERAARAFMRAYPESPHAQPLQRFVVAH